MYTYCICTFHKLSLLFSDLAFHFAINFGVKLDRPVTRGCSLLSDSLPQTVTAGTWNVSLYLTNLGSSLPSGIGHPRTS